MVIELIALACLASAATQSPTPVHEESLNEIFEHIGWFSLAICTLVIFALLVSYYLHSLRISWLPESIASMVIGALIGLVFVLGRPDEVSTLSFDPPIFFFALLPPIILEAGYTMKRKNFFKNMHGILLYSVPGTLVSTALVGFTLFYARVWLGMSQGLTLTECLLFGSLISATESVAILAVLGGEGKTADQLLYSLVFGESVFNDAICIVLYGILTKYLDEPSVALEFGVDDAFNFLWTFVWVTFASIGLGVGIGLMCSFMFKRVSFHTQPATEFLMVLMFSFISYCLAEIVELSGVMSLFFCAMVLAHYNWYNLSKQSRSSTLSAFKALAKGAETFCFVYLGMTFSISFDSDEYNWNWRCIFLVVLVNIASRAAFIVPFSMLENCRRDCRGNEERISWQMMIIMWMAGMRGSVSFALVLAFPKDSPDRGTFITTTLITVLISLTLFGVIIEKLLQKFGLVQMQRGAVSGTEGGTFFSNTDRSQDVAVIQHRRNSCWVKWRRFDDNVMKPCFGGSLEDRAYTVDDNFGYSVTNFKATAASVDMSM